MGNGTELQAGLEESRSLLVELPLRCSRPRGIALGEDRVPGPGPLEDLVGVIRLRPVVVEFVHLPVLRDGARKPLLMQTEAARWSLGNLIRCEERCPRARVPTMPNSFNTSTLPPVSSSLIIGGLAD